MIEFRRKVFHIVIGLLIAALVYFDILNFAGLFVLCFFSFVFLFLARSVTALKKALLLTVERRENERAPGVGAVFFLLGCFFAVLIFEKNIAVASILILALGDGFSGLIIWNGKYRLLKPSKSVFGLAFAVVISTLAAQWFVGWIAAFLASSMVLLVESMVRNVWVFKVDDNLYVPVLAGAVMSFFLWLI